MKYRIKAHRRDGLFNLTEIDLLLRIRHNQPIDFKSLSEYYNEGAAYNAIGNFRDSGLLDIKRQGRKHIYSLSPLGEQAAVVYQELAKDLLIPSEVDFLLFVCDQEQNGQPAYISDAERQLNITGKTL